jgi:ubiquinone/menaquinone biosynthesis C-methylase UbiE
MITGRTRSCWAFGVAAVVQVALLSMFLIGSVELARGQSSAVEEPAQQEDLDRLQLRKYMGRTIAPFMDASGAEWLTRRTRNQEEHPKKLLAALPIKKGDSVCDFGCGNGFYTLQLAKRVGPRGEVSAVDIQPEMLAMLRERMGVRAIENVVPILATAADPNLPVGHFNLVLMVDVYHELSHPAKVLADVRESLLPEGQLVLVEFREEDLTVPIKPLHKMSQAQVMREILANGFKLVGQFDGLPWQHVMFFARDDSTLPEHQLRSWKPSAEPAKPEPASPGAAESEF